MWRGRGAFRSRLNNVNRRKVWDATYNTTANRRDRLERSLISTPYKPFGVTKNKRVTFRLFNQGTLAGGAGSIGWLNVNCTGLYDPIDGTAVQVAGFDQWGTMYADYVVLRSTIRIKVWNLSASAEVLALVTKTINGTTQGVGPTAVIETAINHQTTKWKLLRQTTSTADAEATLVTSFDIGQDMGYFNALNDDGCRGTIDLGTGGTNPTETMYFNFGVSGFAGAAASVAYTVEAWYDAVLVTPRLITDSSP